MFNKPKIAGQGQTLQLIKKQSVFQASPIAREARASPSGASYGA
jgi:hypothetical protein